MASSPIKRSAFTLVELAVVIAILALLVGGIIGGQAILKGQRMRNIITDMRAYALAFEQFNKQYAAIPGDFSGATAFWGRADGVAGTANCTNQNYTYSAGKPTCNGDGDGELDWYTASVAVPPPHEQFRAWQHMAAAGFIAGNFNGAATTANWAITSASALATLNGWKYSFSYSFPGTPANILPAGPFNKTHYAWLAGAAIVDNAMSADAVFFDGDYSNSLLFGGYLPGLGGPAPGFAPALTTQEQYEIDQKFDDGMPATGTIRAPKRSRNSTATCPNGTTITAPYNLSETSVACSIIFMTQEFNAKGGRN